MLNAISGNVITKCRRIDELDPFRSVWVAERANGIEIPFIFTERHLAQGVCRTYWQNAYIYPTTSSVHPWNPELETEIIAVMKRQFPTISSIQKL